MENKIKVKGSKIENFVKNAWFILFCNICSIFGLILNFVFDNVIFKIIMCIIISISTTIVAFYLIIRVFSIRRAKRNIEATSIAKNKIIFSSLHIFYHELRDSITYIRNNVVTHQTFVDKATLLCDKIEHIFKDILETKVCVCIKCIETDSILNEEIDDWKVYTFSRSSSTQPDRYQNDHEPDKIIENTDFEIIVSDDPKFQHINYFCCEDLDSYPQKFKEKYLKEFRNSHENPLYKSTIITPIRISCQKASNLLKGKFKDGSYYHIIAFLCIDSEEKFIDEPSNFKNSIFKNSAHLACSIGDSLYPFFEQYLIDDIRGKNKPVIPKVNINMGSDLF